MSTHQKDLKDFERAWSAVRSANREARKEGVGLLSPVRKAVHEAGREK